MSARPLNQTFDIANSRYKIEKYNDCILNITVSTHASTIYHCYDFVARVLITQNGSTGSSPQVTPFSLLDRESLEYMHGEMIRQGGKPPDLPVPETEKPRPALAKPRPAS